MVKKVKDYWLLWGFVLGCLAWLVTSGQLGLSNWLEMIGLVIGSLIGWWMPWFDRVAYVFILHPETQVGQYVKYLVTQKRYKEAVKMLRERGDVFDKLTTRSALFGMAWVVLAIFAITSVPSWFGKMLVMCLGLRVIHEQWLEYGKDKLKLKQKLFWQIQREISDKELKWYVYVGVGIFVWLTLVML